MYKILVNLEEGPIKIQTSIKSFLEICDTQKHNGVSSNVIRLMLFLFSIKDKVKIWFYSLHKETIVTWDEIAATLLAKYLPLAKVSKL